MKYAFFDKVYFKENVTEKRNHGLTLKNTFTFSRKPKYGQNTATRASFSTQKLSVKRIQEFLNENK